MILNNKYKLLILLLIFFSFPRYSYANQAYHIEISKQSQRLSVFKGKQEIERYHMAYGKGGNATKQRLGDNLTPFGVYHVTNFKTDSQFTLFMQLNYPNRTDAWHAYHDKIIDAYTYKRIVEALSQGDAPPQDTPLGGYIGIHGIGSHDPEQLETHLFSNWTKGCVAIQDEEIIKLRQYVQIGTAVYIRP